MRILHPCDYGFTTSNIRILGASVSGGRSLSGIEDQVQTDGGGYRAVDLSNGIARTRDQNLAIRALIDDVGTTQPMIVLLCVEHHFQPVNGRKSIGGIESWNTPVADEAPDKGSNYASNAAIPLRGTSMGLTGNSEIALQGGELFSINHATWGWRAYRVTTINPDGGISFRPPLREAIPSGTPLEFDNPRCQMRFASVPDLNTDQGVRTALTLTLVEDMRSPS